MICSLSHALLLFHHIVIPAWYNPEIISRFPSPFISATTNDSASDEAGSSAGCQRPLPSPYHNCIPPTCFHTSSSPSIAPKPPRRDVTISMLPSLLMSSTDKPVNKPFATGPVPETQPFLPSFNKTKTPPFSLLSRRVAIISLQPSLLISANFTVENTPVVVGEE